MIRQSGSCVYVRPRILTAGSARFSCRGLAPPTPGVLRATTYNSRPATALTTSRKKRLGVKSSAFVPRTSTLGLVPLS